MLSAGVLALWVGYGQDMWLSSLVRGDAGDCTISRAAMQDVCYPPCSRSSPGGFRALWSSRPGIPEVPEIPHPVT